MENELSAEVDVLSLGSEGSEDEEPTVDFDPRIDYQNDKDPNALDLIGKRVQVPISYYGRQHKKLREAAGVTHEVNTYKEIQKPSSNVLYSAVMDAVDVVDRHLTDIRLKIQTQ